MRPQSRITYHFLLLIFLLSCNSQAPQPSLQTTLYVFRFNPPAFVEFSIDFQLLKEIPFSIPVNCGLLNTFPAPMGKYIAMELNCPNGQTVLFLDTSLRAGTEPDAITQPITDIDSHFLAWTADGKAAYLKVDSLGNAHIARVDANGNNDFIPVTEFTYDLAANPTNNDFTFTFSHGLGQGSELWLAKQDGNVVEQLTADQFNYISFARYSPDGSRIAFIKIPDTQTPFSVGELWIMNNDGTSAHKLADADAGHGYAANWSPDGKKLAFVVRENPADEHADQSSDSLISNVYVVDIKSGALQQITHLENGRVETPFWSPDGNTLAFNVVMNDRMEVQIADVGQVGSSESGGPSRDPTGKIRSLIAESSCCPAWMRK